MKEIVKRKFERECPDCKDKQYINESTGLIVEGVGSDKIVKQCKTCAGAGSLTVYLENEKVVFIKPLYFRIGTPLHI